MTSVDDRDLEAVDGVAVGPGREAGSPPRGASDAPAEPLTSADYRRRAALTLVRRAVRELVA